MKKIFKYTLLAAFGIILLSGCKKLDDVNTNPNQPGAVPPNVQLTASEIQLGFSVGGDMARYTAIFDQQIAGADRQFAVFNSYNFVNSDFDQLWQNLYLTIANF